MIKQDIVLELASNGAFEGSHNDYFLEQTPELSELIQDNIVGQSALAGCFNLTPKAQAYIKTELRLKKKCVLSRYCRNKPFDELSVLELIWKLKEIGWSEELKAPGARIAPYSSSRSKKIWCRLDSKAPQKSYLIVLMQASELLENGLPGIHHLQSDSYYRAILHCHNSGSEKLKDIVPNKPAVFYQQIMGRKAKPEIAMSSRGEILDGEDISVFDQLARASGAPDTLAHQPPNEPDNDDGPLSRAHIYRRLYIRHQDLMTFGYSENCTACSVMQTGKSRTGILHSEECRERIMKSLSTTRVGKKRLSELASREDRYVASVKRHRAES